MLPHQISDYKLPNIEITKINHKRLQSSNLLTLSRHNISILSRTEGISIGSNTAAITKYSFLVSSINISPSGITIMVRPHHSYTTTPVVTKISFFDRRKTNISGSMHARLWNAKVACSSILNSIDDTMRPNMLQVLI